MKFLLILRHAKSSWKDPRLEDFDRPLNKRGKRDALRIAEFVLNAGLRPDVIITSPARRARDTAEVVRSVCSDTTMTLNERLYPGGIRDYVEVLKALDDSIGAAMLVGHNPGLEEWLETLGVEVDKFPTGALARIELDVDSWRNVGIKSRGVVRGIWKPREL